MGVQKTGTTTQGYVDLLFLPYTAICSGNQRFQTTLTDHSVRILTGGKTFLQTHFRTEYSIFFFFFFSFQSLVSSKVPFYYKLNCASLLFTLGSYQVPVKDLCFRECCLLAHNPFKKNRVYQAFNLSITLSKKPQKGVGIYQVLRILSFKAPAMHADYWKLLCLCAQRSTPKDKRLNLQNRCPAFLSPKKTEHHPLSHFKYPFSFILNIQMLSFVALLFHILDI